MSIAAERTVAVAVDVTFLCLAGRPVNPPPPLPPGARVTEATRCTTGFYRYLYDTVGHDYVWWLRRTLTDQELGRVLADPGVIIHVLYKDGEPAGFYEIDRRNRPLVNLSYFGLMPHAVGAGLGRAFLGHAVEEAWAQGTRALTVNTCTADHPRALPNYLAMGFGRLRTVREVWNVPLHLGLPIPSRLRIG